MIANTFLDKSIKGDRKYGKKTSSHIQIGRVKSYQLNQSVMDWICAKNKFKRDISWLTKLRVLTSI